VKRAGFSLRGILVLLVGFLTALAGLGTSLWVVPTPSNAAADPSPVVSSSVPNASVEGPVLPASGIDLPGTTSFNLRRVGYEQSEYFISGTANSYTSASPLNPNGRWNVAEAQSAPYRTRIVVYRPINPKRFDGTVVAEWLNVSGGEDAGAAWLTDHVQMIRSGMVYVGVSAQAVGVDGIKTADPTRYGSLEHPGDDYSYSIYQQAGAAIHRDAAKVLGGLSPQHVLALGESQSAIRLVTYIDALGPQSRGIYDGYFVYSSAKFAGPLTDVDTPEPTFIRTDLRVPVMLFETETDLIVGGYAAARQPPTRFIREWEIAGGAHYDSYGLGPSMTDTGNGKADVTTFDTMIHPVSSADGGAISCPAPFNAGAHTYELRAAVVALNNWVIAGKAPPQSPRLKMSSATTLVTDQNGEAVGGVRTPQVQAPIAVVSGVPAGGGGFCVLFGKTVPFSSAKLAKLYPTHALFVHKWDRAVAAAVAAGYLLPADAKNLDDVAAHSTIGG
jgi:hypothetical protein